MYREQQGASFVHLIGADEFIVDRPENARPLDMVPTPAKVQVLYDKLGVDVGYLSAAAKAWFGDVTPPRGFELAGDRVRLQIIERGPLKVGVALLPELPKPTPKANSSVVLDILKELEAAKAQTDILVALSPWGFDAEADLAPQLANSVDLLYGAGPGAPFAGESQASATIKGRRMQWSRLDVDGRCVVITQVYPEAEARQGSAPAGFRFDSREQCLDKSFDSDPQIEALLKEK